MIKYSVGLISKRDDRHGPAEGVIPVLTPINPYTANNLLVFYHYISFEQEKVLLNNLHRNTFLPTISLNIESFIT